MTTVSYRAVDAAGNEESAKEHVVRLDRTAPDLSGLPSDCRISPPSHAMVQVAVVGAADGLSGVSTLEVAAESSEPQNPNDPDVVVTPDGNGGYTVALRAERRGNGHGRTYTITAAATDNAGNTQTATATCLVPHDQGTN